MDDSGFSQKGDDTGDDTREAGQSVFVLCAVFHAAAVWVDAGSFHKFNQAGPDRER